MKLGVGMSCQVKTYVQVHIFAETGRVEIQKLGSGPFLIRKFFSLGFCCKSVVMSLGSRELGISRDLDQCSLKIMERFQLTSMGFVLGPSMKFTTICYATIIPFILMESLQICIRTSEQSIQPNNAVYTDVMCCFTDISGVFVDTWAEFAAPFA